MVAIHIREYINIRQKLPRRPTMYIKHFPFTDCREEKSESSSEASKPDSPSAHKSPNEDKGLHSDGHEASEEGSESDKSNTGGDFEML